MCVCVRGKQRCDGMGNVKLWNGKSEAAGWVHMGHTQRKSVHFPHTRGVSEIFLATIEHILRGRLVVIWRSVGM